MQHSSEATTGWWQATGPAVPCVACAEQALSGPCVQVSHLLAEGLGPGESGGLGGGLLGLFLPSDGGLGGAQQFRYSEVQ